MQEDDEPFLSPGERFSRLFRDLVDFRGPEAETELYDLFGQERVTAFYEGVEPNFGEFFEIARILNIPFSAFAQFDPGNAPEVELLVAEILYYSAGLADAERRSLVEALLHTLRRHAGKPDTTMTVLRLIENANEL